MSEKVNQFVVQGSELMNYLKDIGKNETKEYDNEDWIYKGIKCY
jgi:hypothetical protein